MMHSTKLRHILQEFQPNLSQKFRNKFTLKHFGQSQVPRPIPSVLRLQVVTFKNTDKSAMSFTKLFTYLRISLLNNGFYRIGLWRSIIGPRSDQVRAGQTAADKIGICDRVQNIIRLHFLRDKFVLVQHMKTAGSPGSGAGKGGGSGGAIREAGGALGKKGAVQEERYFRKKTQELIEKKKKEKPKKPDKE